ncbi:MAG: hypothetical protein Q9219_000101 [cf. Caloplaca sp. 3 TL-2023]
MNEGPHGRLEPAKEAVAASRRQPPPEAAESIRVRQVVILSFWAIVFFLGIPVWLWTTSIHRARLPLQQMMDWAEGKVCKPSFPLQIVVEGPSLPQSDVLRVIQATQHALDDRNDFSLHHLRLRMGSDHAPSNFSQQSTQMKRSFGDGIQTQEKALTVILVPQNGLATARAELRTQSASLDIIYPPHLIPPASSTAFPLATFVAGYLQELFTEEQALITHTLVADPALANNHQSGASLLQPPVTSNNQAAGTRGQQLGHIQASSPEFAARKASNTARALKYAPTYYITISLFSPTARPSSWDIESAISEYLTPLLHSASLISEFTVDTQVQLYARFSESVREPEYDANRSAWTLREEDLSGFINAAEWPLSPSIGAGPTLNFIVYVPDPSTSPLIIKESGANSWMVPQWGGVVILNPPSFAHLNKTAQASLSKEDIQPAILVFSRQLLSFLGAPKSPPSIPLQLQTLTRVRAVSLLLSASATMGSLARLTVALPSIAIPETVSTAVDVTLEHLGKTCNALKDGRFTAALDNAKTAETAAERGFFEKSMVGQVYFPDEHKVAVYLPLLGPVGVPLVMSALKEVRRIWTLRRSSRQGP